MNKLLDIITEIQNLNPEYSFIITGSLALYLNGVDLKREIHDIDLLVDFKDNKNIIQNINVNGEMIKIRSGNNSIGYHLTEHDIIIDTFLYDGKEDYRQINNFKVALVENIALAKKYYVENKTDNNNKHKNDLNVINKQL